ncbi:MAG: sigma 54-interacting transcriptional regulator [Desulfobulbus sp.]|jgi:two-component system response regulator AtoC
MQVKKAALAYECPPESRTNLVTALASQFDLTFQNDPNQLRSMVKKRPFDIIFLHLPKDRYNRTELLDGLLEQIPHTPVIATYDSEEILQDEKLYEHPIIYDVLDNPPSPRRIRQTVRHALDKRKQENELAYLRGTQDIIYNFDNIVAESENFKAVLRSLEKFAATDATILLTGNTGTGKSFLSGSVHYNSPRKKQPFIKINCANISETLLESELFGHEKGAFTGADKQRIGRFEQADGGTVFLDEIGEISPDIQARLLRVLEDKSFERVGGNKTISVDVRLIAATNKDLPTLIAEGKFREDLYYRISVLPVHLPQLKERPQCLEPLAMRLLRKATANLNKSHIRGFTAEAMQVIQKYDWPGNIRQLGNTIERAVILEDGDEISLSSIHIPEMGRAISPHIPATENLEMHERELILKALADNLWVQKNAAQSLGISPRALNYKIKKFGITHQSWRKHKK